MTFFSSPPLSSLSRFFFFLMIRRPPRSTLDRSSAASDVYKRQLLTKISEFLNKRKWAAKANTKRFNTRKITEQQKPVSYTHLRAHETVLDLVCRLLLEKKKNKTTNTTTKALLDGHNKESHQVQRASRQKVTRIKK
mgnify:CR=1 FL=1